MELNNAFQPDAWQQGPGGIWRPAQLKRAKPYPLAFDLFAGAGGFSLGVMQAGFHVIGALEWSLPAAITYMVNLCRYPSQMIFDSEETQLKMMNRLEKTYEAWQANAEVDDSEFIEDVTKGRLPQAGSGWLSHHPDVPGGEVMFIGDIRKFDPQVVLKVLGLEPGDLDLIVGGPPCQGFSRAGKQNILDPRNSYIFDFMQWVAVMQPKTMVLENVPEVANMITLDGRPVVDAAVDILVDGGYARAGAMRKLLRSLPEITTHTGGSVVFHQQIPTSEKEPESTQLSLL